MSQSDISKTHNEHIKMHCAGIRQLPRVLVGLVLEMSTVTYYVSKSPRSALATSASPQMTYFGHVLLQQSEPQIESLPGFQRRRAYSRKPPKEALAMMSRSRKDKGGPKRQSIRWSPHTELRPIVRLFWRWLDFQALSIGLHQIDDSR